MEKQAQDVRQFQASCGDPECNYFGLHTEEDHPQMDETFAEEARWRP